MRIVIAGPPKTGNMWLKCLLGSIYDLKWVKNSELPRKDVANFKEWVKQGGFPDGTIFHQHYWYSDEFCRAVEEVPAHLVTIIRDPYDAFVSTYFTIQQRAADGKLGGETAADVLAGKPLDHPDVLTFLQNGGYRGNLRRAVEWMHSGRAVVLRYEELYRDAMDALTRAIDQISPVAPERIARAIEECSAENMRQSRGRAKHVRTATVGDSKNHLSEQHLKIFRERDSDLIRKLGYEVR